MANRLEYKGYTGTFDFDDEFKYFHGRVIGLNRDLIMFEGASAEELVADFRGAIDDYLQFCKEVGDEPEKPFKGVFNVRIGPERHQALARDAEEKGVSMNAMLNRILDERYATA